MSRYVCVWLVLAMLGGCATDAPLANRLEYCCGPKDVRLSTYSLTFTSVPSFLIAPLKDELGAALAAKGMHETTTNPDALVTLHFDAVYPDSGRPLANDGFMDPLASGGPRKFEAELTIEIRRASDNAEVLRGMLSREHTEYVGTYDHHRAREAFRAGFDHLLRRLPNA